MIVLDKGSCTVDLEHESIGDMEKGMLIRSSNSLQA